MARPSVPNFAFPKISTLQWKNLMAERIQRNPTREVIVGTARIGAGHPIAVQSMCATHTQDIDATVAQVQALHAAGADVIRIAVDSDKDAEALAEIRNRPLPISRLICRRTIDWLKRLPLRSTRFDTTQAISTTMNVKNHGKRRSSIWRPLPRITTARCVWCQLRQRRPGQEVEVRSA